MIQFDPTASQESATMTRTLSGEVSFSRVELARLLRELLEGKFGSLEDAFRWLDTFSRKQISKSNWTTGFRIMQITGPLKDVNAAKIFVMIDNDHEGAISLRKWRRFFEHEGQEPHEPPQKQSRSQARRDVAGSRPGSANPAQGDAASGTGGHKLPWDTSPGPAGHRRHSGPGGKDSDGHAQRFAGVKGARAMERLLREFDALTTEALEKQQPSRRRMGILSASDDTALHLLDGRSNDDILSRRGLPALLPIIEALADCDDFDASCDSPGAVHENSPKSVKAAARRVFVTSDAHRAEESQLADDIQAMGLRGIAALRYIFMAKCGSLEAAFRWLDCGHTGHFARVHWETAAMILHIDMEKLTGMRPREIYNKMANRKGLVTKANWDAFFNSAGDLDTDAMEEHARDFQRKARQRLKHLWAPTVPQGPKLHAGRRSSQKDKHEHEHEKQRNHSKQSASENPQQGTSTDETGEKAPVAPVATLKAPEVRSSVGSRQSSKASTDNGTRFGGSRHRKADGGGVADAGTSGGSSLIDFKQRVMEELALLGPDEFRNYTYLRRVERGIVEEVAAELKLWTQRTDYGNGNVGVIVLREGPEAARIRKELGALQGGDNARFAGLSLGLQALVKKVSDSYAYWYAVNTTAEDVECIDVYNPRGSMDDFRAWVRRMLEPLPPGSHINFPTALTKEHREVVAEIAEELELASMQMKEVAGTGDYIAVENLREFVKHLREDLDALKPGQAYVCGADREYVAASGLSPIQQHVAHQVADQLGLASRDLRSHKVPAVSIKKPKGYGQQQPGGIEAPAAEPEDMEQKIDALFEDFATGKNGVPPATFFLRKPDLFKFIEHAVATGAPRAARWKSGTETLIAEIEQVYDDTLELQIDMSSRLRHGITREYFQVFLGKAANVLGWSLVSLLFAMLDGTDS